MMKGMLSVILALAMVISYVPMTRAEDSATLGLQVTFDIDEPLEIWTDPEGPFTVQELDTMQCRVIAEDLDAGEVNIEQVFLGVGASLSRFEWPTPNRCETMLTYTPPILTVGEDTNGNGILDPGEDVDGDGNLDVDEDINGNGILDPGEDVDGDGHLDGYEKRVKVAEIKAYNNDEKEVALQIYVTVTPARIIAIEIEGPNPWVMDNVRLGALIDNNMAHGVNNIGNVAVDVYIRYKAMLYNTQIQPGFEQGLDRYITMVGEDGVVLSPSSWRVPIAMQLAPELGVGLKLTYGAPTELSEPYEGMSADYDILAYPVYVID